MTCYPTRYHELDVVTSAPQYASGDTFGEKLIFQGALREPASNGAVLETLTLIGMNTETFAFDILFFDEDFLAGTDNSPFSTDDNHMANQCLGKVSVLASDWIATSNHALATVNGIGMALQSKSNGNIYSQMIVRGTPTPGDTDIYFIKLGLLKD